MIKKKLREIIENTFINLFDCNDFADFSVEFSKNLKYGDFSTNICILISNRLNIESEKIGKIFIERLNDPTSLIEKASYVSPGFINFKLSNKFFSEILSFESKYGEEYKTNENPKKNNTLVEFVSANPTGPLHLGHSRGAFFGDSVCSLLEFAGHNVTREFYINDFGIQIKSFAKSLYFNYLKLFLFNRDLSFNEYNSEYVMQIARYIKHKYNDKWAAAAECTWLPVFTDFGIKYNLKNMRKTLDSIDIYFDNWFSEKNLYDSGKIVQLVSCLKESEALYRHEGHDLNERKIRSAKSKAFKYMKDQSGGVFLNTSRFYDNEDRIIIKSNSEYSYLIGDLAYHKEKLSRGFDQIVDLFGADHFGHFSSIRSGVKVLNFRNKEIEFIIVQMMRLLSEGMELSFSKRKGNIYTINDLIEKIGVDSARFIFLTKSSDAQFDFDLGIVLEKNMENPVFYIQYGYARVCTLLNRAKNDELGLGKDLDAYAYDFGLKEERIILSKISSFPDIIGDSVKNLDPHIIVNFCKDIIKVFHSYFTKYKNSEKIISSELDKTKGRLALINVLRLILKKSLLILKISAPERMDF